MAFHVACPITCRRVCDCELGFPPELRDGVGREGFLAEVAEVEEFFRDPWTLRSFLEEDAGAEEETVQVLVPRVALPPPQPLAATPAEDGGGVGDEAKMAVMKRKALAESVAAEDYVRRLEAGGGADALGETIDNNARDDQGSIVKIICRICFSGENEGSKKALKMLSCKTCSKKYHKSCLTTWAENREKRKVLSECLFADLFHWSSWSCPSCRICEVCRRAGDPNKFMFCKRCDGAYHCYCQHPPHKNVGHGPYLCPKHTRCHSCGSTIPGSGLSTRWFLGYTCCDACGRLFVKGNYCPVCLKVYRDSEITPMVCCDVCERWVHCMCDGISDEKYQQFQVDSNLQYKCAACRGDCYQVKDIDDAVRELWKRRNIADRELISCLRVAAGLPPEENISPIAPYSDDEQNGPVLKNENNKALKFSVKGIGEKTLRNSKDYGKNASNKKLGKKKGYQIKIVSRRGETYQNYEKGRETRSLESIFRDQKVDEVNSNKADGPEVFSSPISQSLNNNGTKSCSNEVAAYDQSNVRETADNNIDMVTKVRIKGKQQVLQSKESSGKNDTLRGTKLVIHIGSKNRNVSGSPHSETSSCHKDQDLAASFGEDTIQKKSSDCKNKATDDGRFIKLDDERGANSNNTKISKRGVRNIVNVGKVPEGFKKVNGSIGDECELNATGSSPLLANKNDTTIVTTAETVTDNRSERVTLKHSMDTSIKLTRDNYDTATKKLSSASSTDHKPLLKLKFKNPYFEQRSSWALLGEDENSVKGQRSKRKRPTTEKIAGREDASSSQLYQENLIDAAIDASWILKKLGKDAVGKRVEVQSTDCSWKRGVISDVNQSSSTLSVSLDDGRFQALELGKQAIRFIPQKQKRSRT